MGVCVCMCVSACVCVWGGWGGGMGVCTCVRACVCACVSSLMWNWTTGCCKSLNNIIIPPSYNEAGGRGGCVFGGGGEGY